MGTVDGESYDEEEVGNYQVGNVDEGSDYEEEVGNDDEVALLPISQTLSWFT